MNAGAPRLRLEPAAGLAALALCLAGSPAAAEDGGVHGRLELQDAGSFARADSLDAALGLRTRNDALADLRLTWEPSRGPWTFSLQYDATLQYGDGVPLARAEGGVLPAAPSTWLDLTDTF